MGNCQAVDTATLIIQHPNGKVDRLFWPVNASEIMKTNPGHYLALLISSQICKSELSHGRHVHTRTSSENNDPVRLTRIKLLKPTDSLVLGQVYRLITAQEVLQGLREKKEAKKLKKYQLDSAGEAENMLEQEKFEEMKHERSRVRKTTSTASTANKSRSSWQPSLKSISEAGS